MPSRTTRDPIPEDVFRSVPERPFELDKEKFLHNLRTARRGAAGRASGMRTEHNEEDSNKFFEVAQSLAQSFIPEEPLEVLRVGHMTALQNGDVIRRLVVAKTMAKQFITKFEATTKPFQYALATREGSESIAHKDEEGVVHEIPQGESGEQRDPLMQALFALGQHHALETIQESLQPSETLMAFLDDVYVTTPPERTATVEQSVEANLWSHARIQMNQGKTQVWNRFGERPPDCDHLFFRTDGTPNDV